MFDRIYLLASGKEVYQGPGGPALSQYFKAINKEIPKYTNPADYLIKAIHAKENPDKEDIKQQNILFKEYDDRLKQGIFNEMDELQKLSSELNQDKLKEFRVSSFGLQFCQLLKRCSLNLIRNATLTRVRTGQIIILGILIDILFWNKSSYSQGDVRDKNGALFFISVSQFMLSIQSVLLTCTNIRHFLYSSS